MTTYKVVLGPTPFRPTPWETACNWRYWSLGTPLTTPNVDGFVYTYGADTPTGQPRLDIDHYRSWGTKRFWGYVADISEGTSENTATPYEFVVIGRIPFMEDYLARSNA